MRITQRFTPLSRLVLVAVVLGIALSFLAAIAQAHPHPQEGGPGWDCTKHGNGLCGPYVNVNTATLEQLAYLPYVGEKLAAAILAGRPFKTRAAVCDVPRVPCGSKRSVLPWVRVSGKTTAKAPIVHRVK